MFSLFVVLRIYVAYLHWNFNCEEYACRKKMRWEISLSYLCCCCFCRMLLQEKKTPIKFATIVYKKHLPQWPHTQTHADINRRKKSGKAENSKNNQSLLLLFNLSTDDWTHHMIQQILPSQSNFLVLLNKKYFLLQNSSKYCLVLFTWINFCFHLWAI